jgi:hypothetical protein
MPIADDDDRDTIFIMPNAWQSFTTFLECQTQWRAVAGMSGMIWLGLDYVACKLVIDALDLGKEVFADLRIMEAAALAILNEAD